MTNKIKLSDLKKVINEPENPVNLIILNNDSFNESLFNFLSEKTFNIDLMTLTNKEYITLNLKGTNKYIKVPFNYIVINTNKKLLGIPYINFEYVCSCKLLGLCPISDSCYSLRDQNRFKNNNYKICLNVLFFKEVQKNKDLFKIVIRYLKKFDLIRYNCNNDLNSIDNFKFLISLATELKETKIQGYTKRTDLIKDILNLKRPENLILNGSNYMIDNNFNVTTDLKYYVSSNYYCLGVCRNCLKCFHKRNKNIDALLHGPLNIIDKQFNTTENRAYLINVFNSNFELNINESDLKVNKGLLSSLNKYFKLNNIDTKFKNYNELITLLRGL